MESTNTRLTYQEKQYVDLCKTEVGRCVDIEKWEDQGEKRKYLEDQTKDIARKLDQGYNLNGLGWRKNIRVEPYAHTDLFLMGLNSLGFKKLEGYRNIIFLPSVAQKNRRPRVKELQLFLKHNRNCRMWTFTAGPRINLSKLRETTKWLHRKLSKLNDQEFMKRVSARFVFRSTEFGELAHDGENDLSLHPHMHALLQIDKFISPEKWSNTLERIRAFWGAYCKDCGRIENPRELVKYCVKPSDLEGLNNQQLIKLYNSTQGLRLWESLKDFRKMRRNIREEHQKVVLRKGIPKLVPNWNGGSSSKSIEKQVLPRWMDIQITEDIETETILGKRSRPLPRIVAWCSPAPVFTPISEPLFMVHGLDGRDPKDFFDNEAVRRVRSAINVHNKTLTVLKDSPINNKQSKYNEINTKKPPKDPIPTNIY